MIVLKPKMWWSKKEPEPSANILNFTKFRNLLSKREDFCVNDLVVLKKASYLGDPELYLQNKNILSTNVVDDGYYGLILDVYNDSYVENSKLGTNKDIRIAVLNYGIIRIIKEDSRLFRKAIGKYLSGGGVLIKLKEFEKDTPITVITSGTLVRPRIYTHIWPSKIKWHDEDVNFRYPFMIIENTSKSSSIRLIGEKENGEINEIEIESILICPYIE